MLNVLGNILNLTLDDSRAAREAAAEAARGSIGAGTESIPDSKVEEAKAGGFFSRMGKAVMNPMKALGSGMKGIGKGIQGILTGIARGLMAFANPMVLIGVTVMALSLPIFAAGLAAAFKVFEMIAGEGKALGLVTGIIESLGKAIGTVLHDVLVGFGKMVKEMGPFLTAFFDGLATVIKALEPIIVSIFKIIKDIITDPVLNKTIQTVLKLIQSAITDIKDVLVAFAPVVEVIFKSLEVVIVALAGSIEKIVATIGSVITKILGSFDNVVNQIEPIINAIGASITKIIDSIAAGITKVVDGIVTGIERLAKLEAGNMAAVAAGLVLLAGGLVLFSVGAMIGGAAMPSKETLEGIAKSVEKFGAIDATNLSAVGTGMLAVGAGLAVFGVGGKLAELLKTKEGGLESVAASVSKFGEIDATNFAMVGDGIVALGKGLATFGVGGLLAGISEGIGKFFGASDPVNSQSSPLVLPTSDIKPGNGENVLPG
jgi:hypothetical protein